MATVRHTFPCRKIIFSASHDQVETEEEAIEYAQAQAQRYIQKRLPCVSFKFQRAKDSAIDQNKFLLPAFPGIDGLESVPLMALEILAASPAFSDIIVVGSQEVGQVVSALRTTLDLSEERLRWVDETPPSRPGLERLFGPSPLSLANSLRRGIEALSPGPEDSFYFAPLDLPFFYDFIPLCYDPDLKTHAAVFDLNGRQRMFPQDEFLVKNYYHTLDGIDVKEPNVFGLSASLRPSLEAMANLLYGSRQQGGLTGLTFLQLCSFRSLGALLTSRDLPHAFYAFYKHNRLESSSGERLLSLLMKGLPVRLKVEHTNPFRVFDVDAWHEAFTVQRLFQTICQHTGPLKGLERYVPFAPTLFSLNEEICPVKKKIGILDHYCEYAEDYTERIGMKEFLGCSTLYDAHGRLLVPPAPGEHDAGILQGLAAQLASYRHTEHLHAP